jgi:hypothetical protein
VVVVMSSSDPRRGLRGRRGECEALDRLLGDARSGRSQVLVLRGEAGIGKSALVEYLVGNAAGCRIARVAGVESEMELAFAGLHQLCAPMMGHLDRIPGPQRDALTVAFGLGTGSPPDRFLVGLAVLSLLAEVTGEQPLVCVVDDAQWLDRVSAQTLAFVARRLLAERVALVFAVRGPALGAGDDPLVGLPELVIRGLDDGDARALLDSVVLGRVDESVRDRIVAEARGNPLALLELPHGMTAAELAGGFGRPDARPLASQIEQSFLRRIGARPSGSTSGRTRRRRPRRRGSSSSVRGCGFAILWCARRLIARRTPENAGTCTARWPRRPIPSPTRIAGPGTAHTRRLNRTRRWRASWSAQPPGPRPGAASRRPPRSCGARPG